MGQIRLARLVHILSHILNFIDCVTQVLLKIQGFSWSNGLPTNWRQVITSTYADPLTHICVTQMGKHDDVIKWKRFPRYWPSVRGIHRSPVNSPHKGQWRGAFFFYDLRLNKQLSKQSCNWWFETPSRSLWRHCNVYIFLNNFTVFLTNYIHSRCFLVCCVAVINSQYSWHWHCCFIDIVKR